MNYAGGGGGKAHPRLAKINHHVEGLNSGNPRRVKAAKAGLKRMNLTYAEQEHVHAHMQKPKVGGYAGIVLQHGAKMSGGGGFGELGHIAGGIAHGMAHEAVDAASGNPFGSKSLETIGSGHVPGLRAAKADLEKGTGYREIRHIRQHPIAGSIALAGILPVGKLGRLAELGVDEAKIAKVTQAAEEAKGLKKVALQRRAVRMGRRTSPEDAHSILMQQRDNAAARALKANRKNPQFLEHLPGESRPETGGDVGRQVREAMRSVKKVYKKQKELQATERLRRTGRLAEAQKSAQSFGELAGAQKKLSGELPKVPFKGFESFKSAEPYVSRGTEARDSLPDLAHKPGYLYHRTFARNLDAIRKRGLLPSFVQGAKEVRGVHFTNNILTTTHLAGKYKFAKEDGMFLRVRAEDAPEAALHPHKSGGEIVTPHAIPPEKIEYLGKDGNWHPVTGSKFLEDIKAHVDSLNMLPHDKNRLVQAISKGLSGQVPNPSERKLIESVFGREVKNLSPEAIQARGIGTMATDVLNLPRAIESSFDLSGMLRQNLAAIFHNPKLVFKNYGQVLHGTVSEPTFQKFMAEEVHANPYFHMAKEDGVPFTEIGDKLNQREEAFGSNLAEHLHEAPGIRSTPGVKQVAKGVSAGVRASDRNYVALLNGTRIRLYQSMVEQAAENGWRLDGPQGEKLRKQIGDTVATLTGRGNMGKTLTAHRATFNALFFSPGLMKSRINLLNPVWYVHAEPFVRQQRLKTALRMYGTLAGILWAAKMGGAKVSTDPTNADFGKIRIGNTRIDIAGGQTQYMRLIGQLSEGKITSSVTGKVEPLSSGPFKTSRGNVIQSFARNKFSPVAGLAYDAAFGPGFGQKLTPRTVAGSMFIPLLMQDMWQITHAHGPGGGPAMAAETFLPDLFGVGIQNYGPPKKKGHPSGGGGSSDFGGSFGGGGSFGDSFGSSSFP